MNKLEELKTELETELASARANVKRARHDAEDGMFERGYRDGISDALALLVRKL